MKIQDLTRTENQQCFIIYRSQQFRWDDEIDVDPITDDVDYHLTEEEAIEAAKAIRLEIGFNPVVSSISIDCDELDFEEDHEFELSDLDDPDFIPDIEDVWNGNVYEGEYIDGSIIIEWSWEKHVGYSRNLNTLGFAGTFPFHDLKTENDLNTGNEERTFRSNFSVLLTAEEVANSDNLKGDIEDALNSESWKWNWFKKNPNSPHIVDAIDEISKNNE